MEDRGVPQDPQIGLSSRGGEAQDRSAPGQSDRGLLHPELARLLDDDAQPLEPGCLTRDDDPGPLELGDAVQQARRVAGSPTLPRPKKLSTAHVV
jgi:hypothetical protein